MSKADLQTRYEALHKECGGSFDALQRSREGLWRSLVRAYLWWRDCQQTPGFLEALYVEQKIGYQATKDNTPNFNPLLRLLFYKPTLSGSERSMISNWNAALVTLHAEFTDNDAAYRTNPEGKLVKLIGDRGGLVQMARKAEQERTQVDEEDLTTKAAKKAITKPPAPDVKRQIQTRALDMMGTLKGTGTVTADVPLRVGTMDLIALLARRMPDGSVVTLGSTSNSEAIRLISEDIAARSVVHLSANLRVILEVLRSQLYPPQSQPRDPVQRAAWRRAVLLDATEFRVSDVPGRTGSKGQRLTSAKKLLIHGADGTLLLSGTKLKSSVVTRCRTKVSLVGKADHVFLRINDRARLEHWLETSEVHVRAVSPAKGLERAAGTEKFTHRLTLKGDKPQADLRMHFYDVKKKATLPTSFQATFKFDSFKPDWSCEVTHAWFGKLREQMLDTWFVKLGEKWQINRANNRLMWLNVSERQISIRFNAVDATKLAADHPMPAGTQWQGGKTTYETQHLSKDIAPVLYNLADAHVTGNIKISGSAHTVLFTYATDMGEFDIAVPAVYVSKKAIVRHEQNFTVLRYG
ncbi:hypothetical protein [Falsiroseomonas ponticola]|uniref:hypothetical protein n=1 Tax=Falsiroseomonas ponticola TaxID=2786951 RepID=UPI0019317462|nr:hypothetical protein [Roseomonas ponticola]